MLTSPPTDILLDKTSPSPEPWLIRIPDVFADLESDIMRALGATPIKRLGRDFRLVHLANSATMFQPTFARWVPWAIPIHHAWPCKPQETPGFIEKAAQTLARKFAAAHPQTLMVGALDPSASNRQDRTLASNLRGRALQLFPASANIRHAEQQNPITPTLFCLLGKEGLFCGLQPPRSAGGFHPGGTKFIRQTGNHAISRAGAKIAEALHFLQLHRPLPPPGAHWLELGASPGGMTAELLTKNFRVTAVDRAPLDARLIGAAGLHPVVHDAATFVPVKGSRYEVILSDMNGSAHDAMAHVIRLLPFLKPDGLVVFTLKTSGVESFHAIDELATSVVSAATHAGLSWLAGTHLTYNRREFTLFFTHTPPIEL